MKYVLLIVLVLFVIEVCAQQRAFNFSFIGNKSSLVDKQTNEYGSFYSTPEVKHVFGSGICFGFERQYRNNMLFEFGFQVNRLGYEVSYYENLWANIQETTIQYYQDYIGIPLKGGYTHGKKIFGFIKLGLIPGVPIGQQIFITRGGESNNPSYILKFSPFRLNLSGNIEVGGGFLIGRKMNIFSSLSYQESLIELKFNDLFPRSNSQKLYALSLALGIKYLMVK